MTRVSVLTPPGTGAIATVSVVGPGAWEMVRAKFRPVKGTLPEVPPLHRFWFGNLGDGAVDNGLDDQLGDTIPDSERLRFIAVVM